MIDRILTVGGLTLVSRVTGFARDIVLAAILGAGPAADAFFVALRLPNHFRAIFAEGAFNAAFVPAYARIRHQGGVDPANLFADRVFTILFGCVGFLVVLALIFTPKVISLLAPGFSEDPGRFALAVELTRITFPYLLFMSLVTLFGGILNALARFAAAAAAPILLNVSMVATLAVAVFFPTPGHAAAWGVFIAGILEALLVGGDTWRNGVMTAFRWPKWDEDVKRFFNALGPATIGSAGMQIALFADTIIASLTAAGQTLAAYAFGLLPFVLIRSATAPFLARGDTATPMKASLTAVGVNVGFKAAFYYFTSLAQVGLALATSIGAWLNLGLVIWFAARRGHFAFGPALRGATARLAAAGLALAVVLSLAQGPVARLFASWTSWRAESTLAVLALIGGAVYSAVVFALFGKQWLAALRTRKRSTPPGPPPPSD